MTNELNPPGFHPEEQDYYHTEDIYDKNDDYIGWKYILDENGDKIPLGICLCHAFTASECGCSCNSWTDSDYDYDDYWYDEQLNWEEHHDMSFDRHLENF